MEVLKDASAAAIYGSRANAGVVLITTKSGQQGKQRSKYPAVTALPPLPVI
jgi:TonB-dependent SusC/RagA subfamily outer membrane receptor